jgi:hypothetical protein
MKKFLKKLAVLVLVNIALINAIPVAFAECNTAMTDYCIDPKNDAGQNFISIMEEPITTIDPKTIENFEARPCYRKTMVCIENGKTVSTNSQLVKSCAPSPQSGDTAKTLCKEVTVILAKGGTAMITGYVAMIYKWAAPIVAMICVLVIVISGLQLSFSGGDSGAVDSAKKRILQSIAGLAVLFLSSMILYTANPNFFTAGV